MSLGNSVLHNQVKQNMGLYPLPNEAWAKNLSKTSSGIPKTVHCAMQQ